MNRKDVHILIVEDEEILRLMFKQSFENWGFRVETAANGKEALEKCQAIPYHIVVTDLNMPIMNGMELLKRIKAKWPFIEVLVITGFATIESAIEAMKLGAYDFILKPVNFDHVQFSINKCYQKIKSQAENTKLKELNAQLIELNELKDKFIYITNHEIRTPLTIIKGYLELLRSILEEPAEDVQEILEILENTTDELVEMIERLHMLEDLAQHQRKTVEEVIDLKPLMQKIYKEIAGLFHSRNIDLKIYIDKNPLFVKGDYRQVRLVLRELLQNALKFTPDGGQVRVRLELKNDNIHYSVQDNGIGIPIDRQEMIFESFYEIQDVINHSSSSKDFMGGGLGIGLNLVKEIVDSLKGKIYLESEPEKGTFVKILLPRYQEIKGFVNTGSSISKQ